MTNANKKFCTISLIITLFKTFKILQNLGYKCQLYDFKIISSKATTTHSDSTVN